MSPEQLRGEPLDVRSDLFSFGLVLYEMATGQRAFAGSTSAVVSAAILMQEPAAPTAARPDLPPRLEETILKALEKRPHGAVPERGGIARGSDARQTTSGTQDRRAPYAMPPPTATRDDVAAPDRPLSTAVARLNAYIARGRLT